MFRIYEKKKCGDKARLFTYFSNNLLEKAKNKMCQCETQKGSVNREVVFVQAYVFVYSLPWFLHVNENDKYSERKISYNILLFIRWLIQSQVAQMPRPPRASKVVAEEVTKEVPKAPYACENLDSLGSQPQRRGRGEGGGGVNRVI